MMNDQDLFIEIGSHVVNTLMKTNRNICSEVVICNTGDVYITIEPRVSLTDRTHVYVCRYIRRDKMMVYLKSSKRFIVLVGMNNGKLTYGIETQDGVVDFEITRKCVCLLNDMYQEELQRRMNNETNFEG